MDEKNVFPGFNLSFNGYSQLPNEWLDNIISQIDNMAELKIVLYVYRHTWGFKDQEGYHDAMKQITTDEFMHGRKRIDGTRMDNGTGLSDRGVKNGIALAIEHGYLICEVDDRDKARVKKSYGLNYLQSTESVSSDGNNIPTDNQSDRKSIPTDRNIIPSTKKSIPTSGNNVPTDQRKKPQERKKEKERMKESTSIHSPTLSSDSLEKVREFAEGYGNDVSKCQERAQEIYQRYALSDDEFYNYLIEAYRRADKSMQIAGLFVRLQIMLEGDFKKRE